MIGFWRQLSTPGPLALWTCVSTFFTILHTFLLLIWNTTELVDIPDSTNWKIFHQTDKPLEETRILHPQITFQSFYTTEEINIPQLYAFNVDLNFHIHHSLPVHIQQFRIFSPPQLHKDRRLQEFLQDEISCQNFINQDLTFLQPSQIYPDRQQCQAPNNIENHPPSSSNTIQDNIAEDIPDIEHEAEQSVSNDYSPQP